MERPCIDCGTPLIGRSDKKFCDDYCRTHFNNQLHKEENIVLKEINKILRKNKLILERLYTTGKITHDRTALLAAGFNFDYFTHQQYDGKGEISISCYEYGYRPMENGKLLIFTSAPGKQ
jgi:hypothetical protein